jgi:hypothetical protein
MVDQAADTTSRNSPKQVAVPTPTASTIPKDKTVSSLRPGAITELGDTAGAKFGKKTSQAEAPTLAGSVIKDRRNKRKVSGINTPQVRS